MLNVFESLQGHSLLFPTKDFFCGQTKRGPFADSYTG